nr:hypothetical protein CFP56_67149 [Quercus suber]
MASLRSFFARFVVAPLRSKFEPRVFQVRVSFVKDVQKQEAWWERQHELAAENFGGEWEKELPLVGFLVQ